jgi:hypothetical protein
LEAHMLIRPCRCFCLILQSRKSENAMANKYQL